MNDQPTSAAVFSEQAFYFIERRRLLDAQRVLKEGLAHHPQDPDLLFHSAQVDWLGDDAKAAEDTARQVLVISPEHPPARQLLASLLIERNEFADAELLLIGLLRDFPEDADLYGRYARLMLRALHLEKAEQLAREGLRYDPDNDECLLAIALCETARSGAPSQRCIGQAAGCPSRIPFDGARTGGGAGRLRAHGRGAPHRAGRHARRPRQ